MGPTEQVTFYDQHPFDWVSPVASKDAQGVLARPLLELIESLDPRSLVLDIGCGPGRVLGLLTQRGICCFGLDRSRISLGLAVERYGRPGVVGDNLHLPFGNGIADVVISDGVIHHTDDAQAAFMENCRILKPDGRMYLAVYKPSGHYPWFYKYPGAVIRRCLRLRWMQPLVVVFAQVPYFLVHFVRSKGKRTWSGAGNLFYDYFVTPQVAFLPRHMVEEWCARQGARILRYDENCGANVHSFQLVMETTKKARNEEPSPVKAEMQTTGTREPA